MRDVNRMEMYVGEGSAYYNLTGFVDGVLTYTGTVSARSSWEAKNFGVDAWGDDVEINTEVVED